VTGTPLWFGPSERPLFGWVHAPDGPQAAGAVVLCPPLARELNSAQATFRHLATEIARAGMLAVRFDYDGTGDSSGSDRDPDRVRAWLDSVGHAVDLARACGAQSVSIVGMRMGALLAAAAAAELRGIDAVVLWDPCRSARSFVREQAALLAMVSDEPEEVVEGKPILGFVFRDDTVADLAALRVPAGGRPPARVLLLTRPDRPATADLAEVAESLGASVTTGTALSQERILEVEPLEREIPAETTANIVAWLRAGIDEPPFAVAVPARSRAGVYWDGSDLCESVVRLGPFEMFGIETAPEVAADSPTVLMFNAGTDSHIGPNRLWVELSRRWAAAGLRCVRFDLTGLGESPARPGGPENVVRPPEAFDDMEDVRQAVEPDDPSNVVLVGLCSGGYQALEDALRYPPRGVYTINPVLHFAPPELATGRMDPRRRICWPTKGLSQAYRSFLMEPVRRRLRKVAWTSARLLNPRRDRDPRQWLDELRQARVEVVIVCGEDQGHAFGSVGAGAPPAGRQDSVRVEIVPGLDSALMPAGQRTQVTDQLTAHLVGHFAPVRAEPRIAAAS
jgi:alpha-beta hydrolase superfamily lysophospholipase